MKALLLVDIQNDFVPGGALAVPGGDQVVPIVNELQPHFGVVVMSQDWHPRDHGSFAANHSGRSPGDTVDLDGVEQILWPIHCVQGTSGAEFQPDLDRSRVDAVFRKGTDPRIDSYSAFFDNARQKDTGLADYLRSRGVKEICVAGLATDYCVRFTALDAIELGLRTYLVRDACRGVELHPGDVDAALDVMQNAGVTLTDAAAIRSGR